MKLGRLIIIAITAVVAVATAVAAVVYFKDEIFEMLAEMKKKVDEKKTIIFHSNEYTDYADI